MKLVLGVMVGTALECESFEPRQAETVAPWDRRPALVPALVGLRTTIADTTLLLLLARAQSTTLPSTASWASLWGPTSFPRETRTLSSFRSGRPTQVRGTDCQLGGWKASGRQPPSPPGIF